MDSAQKDGLQSQGNDGGDIDDDWEEIERPSGKDIREV